MRVNWQGCQTGCESQQQAKARHLSLATSESMAWVTAPLNGAYIMQPPEVTLACRRTLGVRTRYGDGLCPKHGTQQSPHDTLDNHHAVTCGNSGLASSLHKDMAYSLISVAKQCGVGGPMIREDKACFTGRRTTANSKHTEWSMDVTIPLGTISGAPDVNVSSKQILLDANISNPCSITAIRDRHTDAIAGASAAKVKTDKAKKYADTYVPATSYLIVAAFETFGRFGNIRKTANRVPRKIRAESAGGRGICIPRCFQKSCRIPRG
jgi:hypothetical protein